MKKFLVTMACGWICLSAVYLFNYAFDFCLFLYLYGWDYAQAKKTLLSSLVYVYGAGWSYQWIKCDELKKVNKKLRERIRSG